MRDAGESRTTGDEQPGMSSLARAALAKVAHRVFRDPTSVSMDDVKKMAAGILLLLEGKVPK